MANGRTNGAPLTLERNLLPALDSRRQRTPFKLGKLSAPGEAILDAERIRFHVARFVFSNRRRTSEQQQRKKSTEQQQCVQWSSFVTQRVRKRSNNCQVESPSVLTQPPGLLALGTTAHSGSDPDRPAVSFPFDKKRSLRPAPAWKRRPFFPPDNFHSRNLISCATQFISTVLFPTERAKCLPSP